MRSSLLQPIVFKRALLAATVLPAMASLVVPLGLIPETTSSGQWFVFFIMFVSLAHVPSTLYLFSDRELIENPGFTRRQMIYIPLVLVALALSALFYLTPKNNDQTSILLFYVWIGFFMWQHWHFGRQNLGVLAFCLMGPNGRKISSFERLTINLASLCGVLVIYGMAGEALRKKYVDDAAFISHDIALAWAADIGLVLQVSVSIASVLYVTLNRRSFTPLTMTIYLCSASFFLPIYFQDQFILPQFAAAHAFQYMVFLAYHSMSRMDHQNTGATNTGAGKTNISAPCLLILAFLLGGLYYVQEHEIAVFLSEIGNVTGVFEITQNRALLLVIGLDMGVTLAHFWYDSLFWKLRIPSQRKWAEKRFSFMFKNNN